MSEFFDLVELLSLKQDESYDRGYDEIQRQYREPSGIVALNEIDPIAIVGVCGKYPLYKELQKKVERELDFESDNSA